MPAAISCLSFDAADTVREPTLRPELPGHLVPLCHEPEGLAATDEAIAGDGPHLLVEPGAVAATSEHHRSRRPCHPRAISSGHERYLADSHGHLERAGMLATCL
jgi:hypothetical protein